MPRPRKHRSRHCSRGSSSPAATRNWGYQMRFGLFEISESDFRTIAEAMGAEI